MQYRKFGKLGIEVSAFGVGCMRFPMIKLEDGTDAVDESVSTPVIRHAIDNVKRVIEETAGEYTVIVTADHGGHGRGHGSDLPEDMTIPMVFHGPAFAAGKELHGVSILDIAPTIADIMGIPAAREWEGKSLAAE